MKHTIRLAEIALRKERLAVRIEHQRIAVAAAWQRWEKPATLVDRGVAVVKFLKSHPLLLAAGVALVTVLRVRKLKGWLGRGLMLWRIWRSAGSWLRRLFA